jgi:hypothetical protein
MSLDLSFFNIKWRVWEFSLKFSYLLHYPIQVVHIVYRVKDCWGDVDIESFLKDYFPMNKMWGKIMCDYYFFFVKVTVKFIRRGTGWRKERSIFCSPCRKWEQRLHVCDYFLLIFKFFFFHLFICAYIGRNDPNNVCDYY